MLKRLFRKPAQEATPAAPEPPQSIGEQTRIFEEKLEAIPDSERDEIDYNPAPVLLKDSEIDDLQVYKDKAGEYRWKRISSNGSDIVSESGEGYKKLSYTMEMAEKKNPGLTPRFVIER